MKHLKIFAILAATFSLGVMGGCSSTEEKQETPLNTSENTMAVPGGDQQEGIANNDQVSTTYSSADLGTSSSGMGR